MFRNRWYLTLAIAFTSLCGLKAVAQDNVGTAQVFSVGGDGGGVAFQVSGGTGAGAVMASSSFSPLGVDPNSKSALFNLLNNESIRRELKLTDEQQAGAKRIAEESRKRLNDLVRTTLQAGGSLRDAGLPDLIAANRAESESALEEILLPEQLKRIRQLAYQVEIAKLGLGESLTTGKLGQEIGVHDNQKQHLSQKAAEIEAEARVAIAKIRAAAQAKLFAELATEQRQAAQELLGDYFLFEEPSFEQRIRQDLKVLGGNTPPSDKSKQ